MVSNKKETQSKKAVKKNNNKKVVKKTTTKQVGTKKSSVKKLNSNSNKKSVLLKEVDLKTKELENKDSKAAFKEYKTTFVNSSELDFLNKNPQYFSKPISGKDDLVSRISFKTEDREKFKDKESDHDKLIAKTIKHREYVENKFETLYNKEEDPFVILSKIESLVAKYTKESLEVSRNLKMANLLLKEANSLIFEGDIYNIINTFNLNKFADLSYLFESVNEKVNTTDNNTTKVNKLEEKLELIKESQKALNESIIKSNEQQQKTRDLINSIKEKKTKK